VRHSLIVPTQGGTPKQLIARATGEYRRFQGVETRCNLL
jgi:hypothetical protein